MSDRVDIVIVGAGFAGLATARVCAAAGMRVAVLERRDSLESEGAGLTVQPVGLQALERLGLLDQALEQLGEPFTIIDQCDSHGCQRLRFDYRELDHPHPFLMTVERAQLIALLAEGVPVRLGVTVTGLTHDCTGRVSGVRYSDGNAEHALASGWVVGADGRGSRVREAAGIRSWFRTRPERYVVGLVDGEPIRDEGRLYCGAGWADGVLPHPGRIYFFDYVNAENRDAIDQVDFDRWASIYATRVPDAPAVLDCVRSFDDVSVLAGRAHLAWPRVRPGVALAGDAAASVHPHSGQGANFALQDGCALGAALAVGGPDAVRSYGRRQDRQRLRYIPYSIASGRTLDATGPGWRAMRATTPLSGLPFIRPRVLRQHVGLPHSPEQPLPEQPR
jgi:2-polyprenyl-6-methoxyphenol hydroxylase-like FAD-dependent oxidoreductase